MLGFVMLEKASNAVGYQSPGGYHFGVEQRVFGEQAQAEAASVVLPVGKAAADIMRGLRAPHLYGLQSPELISP